jgi:hypothetical protein
MEEINMGNTTLKMEKELNMKTISEELTYIQELNRGLLDPAKVVEYAENPKTLLHSKFEWDDSKCGIEYRLWQARQIIRLELVVIKDDNYGKVHMFNIKSDKDEYGDEGKITRKFVSLKNNRISTSTTHGYRNIVDVLSDEELRKQLLEDAKNDMRIFRRKYDSLNALAKVFSAMDELLQ